MVIQPEDIQTLATMVAEIQDAQSPRPVAGIHNFYYLVPTHPEYAPAIAEIINKYDMPAEQYISSLYKDTPIIRIPKAIEILPTLHGLMKQIRTAQTNQIQTIFSKSDYNKLIKMMSHTCHARTVDKQGKEEKFIYYLPSDKEYTDKALAIFKKYKLPAQLHLSSLNNRMFPVIRVPLNPRTNEAFQNLEIVHEARTKRDALTRGRANILQKGFGTLRDKIQRVFGGDKEK